MDPLSILKPFDLLLMSVGDREGFDHIPWFPAKNKYDYVCCACKHNRFDNINMCAVLQSTQPLVHSAFHHKVPQAFVQPDSLSFPFHGSYSTVSMASIWKMQLGLSFPAIHRAKVFACRCGSGQHQKKTQTWKCNKTCPKQNLPWQHGECHWYCHLLS